ncbi:hypothetical protein Taro_025644 [Colocasia esculenta]|uniref:Uncharacterized protein n=1 Tax=Colocasia esculenta TaxID=4460 RepID=A0A843VAQ4_COLES|nr:hypothetical protein [Colocasia esculenta]
MARSTADTVGDARCPVPGQQPRQPHQLPLSAEHAPRPVPSAAASTGPDRAALQLPTTGERGGEKEAGSAGQTRRLGRLLLLFSLPFQGHINPMFQLATLLFQRGFSVTVIHTLFNALDPSGHPHFRFVAIDDGLPEEVLNCHDILAKAIAITKACRAPFRDCLVRLLEQDRSCMAWLDRHPAGSVIYVSFGSLADMEKEELAEVAWGLAGSGQPFLWVVRLGSVRGEAGVELPAGFVDET